MGKNEIKTMYVHALLWKDLNGSLGGNGKAGGPERLGSGFLKLGYGDALSFLESAWDSPSPSSYNGDKKSLTWPG